MKSFEESVACNHKRVKCLHCGEEGSTGHFFISLRHAKQTEADPHKPRKPPIKTRKYGLRTPSVVPENVLLDGAGEDAKK